MIEQLGYDKLSMHTDYVWYSHWFLNALFVLFYCSTGYFTHFHGSAFWFCRYNTMFCCFRLLSNMLMDRYSDFIALGLFNGFDVIGILGMLSVPPSLVDTIAASRISLRFCWSSHLPACWYIYFYVVHTFLFKIRPGA